MRRAIDHSLEGGVTLVEMIVAIVVAGILLALVGMFGRWQIQSYFDLSNRANLTDAADSALRRMARELQLALPNSVRVSGNYLEFIPIKDAGRYRAETDGSGTDHPLDFGISATASQFDVFQPGVTISSSPPADQVVVYNLGISGSDAYSGANRTGPRTTFGTSLSSIDLPAGFHFPFASPSNHFHVVGNPVTYECDATGGVIRRYSNYGFQASQPITPAKLGGAPAILVSNVDSVPDPSLGPGCSFSYLPGVLQRNGLVFIYLRLKGNDETVNLMQQVEVLNTP